MGAAMNMQPVNLAEQFSILAFDVSKRYVFAKQSNDLLFMEIHSKQLADLGMQVEGIVASEAHCARWDADREWED